MNDLLGTIKRLRHTAPHEAYIAVSKKKLLSAITPPQQSVFSKIFLSLSLGTTGVIALSLLFFHSPAITTPSTLASLDNNTLVAESNQINLETKIKETKDRDLNTKAIDRAIQDFAFAGNLPAEDNKSSAQTNNDVNTLLNELL